MCLDAMDNPAHSSTSLSTIAELVQTRLPRELCDHVYSFLWDDDTTKHFGSDYQCHLLRAGEVCLQVPDGDGNLNCECKLPESMVDFTRSKFVGYQFAHEAVLWLYNNYQGFEIYGLENLHLFLETDVFHVSLSPACAQSVRPRCFSLQVDVRKAHTIAASLGQLTNRQLRHGFTLDITFNYVTLGVNLLAIALETLEPVVTNLEDKYKNYSQCLCPPGWLR
jgi:hypothetical protein